MRPIPDPRRRFNRGERTALYLAADGRCMACGSELEPGWHADHHRPHSRGGATDVINGQALCPTCNLKKGDRTVAELREWQSEALEKFLRLPGDFLCVATPGAGKTRFALAAAEALVQRGEIQKIIVVAPTAHMRNQWARAANAVFGIQLDPRFTNGDGAPARDFDGIAVTYQSVASQPLLYRRIATMSRTLVILDEVHHGGDTLSWGSALREAFGDASRRLLLSGTPDRTDGNAVPFVTYDKDRRFVADYSYDYGQALADRQGVVRPIAFAAMDGDARWLDASSVESKLKLSQTDPTTRAKALSSALLADGPWITSVLRAANDELTSHRELVPDAAGLVVADDQFKAVKYASLLEQISGEKPTLAISDIPDASEEIARFTKADTRWIVAVAMVSEGVDIPRLVVGVYATAKSTELFFKQVAGRFVRTRGEDDYSCATLYIPSVDPLVSYAAEIERTVPRALKEAEERAEREAQEGSGSGRQLEFDMVVPLAPSEAVHMATILSGDSFTEAELRSAEEYAKLANLPANVTPAQAAQLLRIAGMRHAAPDPVQTAPAALTDKKAAVRKDLNRLVGRLHRITNKPHRHINADLNKHCGDTVATASLDNLEKRKVLLARLISDATP
ncbi:DEAD/DEAH box helicase family protein [Micromonospora sp. LOL_021]|uniref:DEAD/DEAH box helicase family protein n=1 Tax=Micromonospora sp. LOL_021 TaxID=3345417 RepID=UPI003A8A7F12